MCLPRWSLVAALGEAGYPARHVHELGLLAASDEQILAQAASEDDVVGLFQIGVRNPTAATTTFLKAIFGSDTEVVDTTAESGAVALASRSDDWEPWFGSDFVTWSGPGTCTTGFSVRVGTTSAFNSTAGHCIRVMYDSAYVGTDGEFGEPVGSHRLMGPMVATGFNNEAHDYLDVEFIRLPSITDNTNIIWGTTVPGTRFVNSTGRASVGQTICTDGAYDLENCGPVNSDKYNQCVVYSQPAMTACHVIKAGPNGSSVGPIVGKGDSGGPVYTSTIMPARDGDSVKAVGWISGGHQSMNCVRYPSRNGSTPGCFSFVYFTDLLYVQAGFPVITKVAP